MKERLLKIITTEGLTPSLLADELGVQRSGISHILSGRNYPSFDFLQKLLLRFPKINAEWLILGQGSMFKSAEKNLSNLFQSSESTEKKTVNTTTPEKTQNLSSGEDDKKNTPTTDPEISQSEEAKKTIEKIIILHKDKTFITYFPE